MFGKRHENEKAQGLIIIITLLRSSAQLGPEQAVGVRSTSLAPQEEGVVGILDGGGGPCFTLAFLRRLGNFQPNSSGLTCALLLIILRRHGADPTGFGVSGSLESTDSGEVATGSL